MRSPCPREMDPDSTEYRDWLLRLPEGKSLAQSACEFGVKRVKGTKDYEGWEARSKEQCGFYVENLVIAINNMNRGFERGSGHNSSHYFWVTCQACQGREIAALKNHHVCSKDGERHRISENSHRKPLYFVHDMMDLLPEDDYDAVMMACGLETSLASAIVMESELVPDRIKNKAVPADNLIYHKEGASGHW